MLKEKELGLKEAEQIGNAEIHKSEINSQTSINISELSNPENLIGYWFIPHGATINIKFNGNGRFEFYKGEKGDENYYIKKSDYYFVNGKNGF